MERLQLFFAYAAKLSSHGLCKNIQQSISKMTAQKYNTIDFPSDFNHAGKMFGKISPQDTVKNACLVGSIDLRIAMCLRGEEANDDC